MSARAGQLSVAELVMGLSQQQLPSDPGHSPDITNAAIDSRQVTPGTVFVALRGERRDGHDFVPEAVAKGAVAVIAERLPAGLDCTTLDLRSADPVGAVPPVPLCILVQDSLAALQQAAAYWRRRHDVRVVGVTGSVGKTTAKEVIAAVLSRCYSTLKTEGNYNNEIGVPLTLLKLASHHERVVLEMGMYDLGEIALLAEIALPQVGVVTNVGPTHLVRLGTIQRIAQAKAELPNALPSAAQGGVAILNGDDPLVRDMATGTSASVFTYGLDPCSDLWADEIESEGLEGIRFRLHSGTEMLHVRLPMLGRHSVHAALCAAATGLAEGMLWPEIIEGLQEQSAQLRLLAVPGPNGSTILDDTYNSSPASCLAALSLLKELEGRRIAVLGDMYELGHQAEEGHRIVGRSARDVADLLIAVGELGGIIGREASDSGMPTGQVYLAESNERAIELLEGLVTSEDVILVKGSRGMRMEEIVVALTEPVLSRASTAHAGMA